MERHWRIDLLGSLRVRRDERSITRFPQRCGHLLAYLAYYPNRLHTRELLADTLWPESAPDVARGNLRVAVYALRRQLAPLEDAARPLLIADWNSVRLDPGAFTTDVAEWQGALAAARESPVAERAEPLAAAADRYHEELLPGFYEEWVLAERARLWEQQIEALGETVAAVEERGDLKRALEYARRAVSADPLREESHYNVMRLYAASGQPSAVLRQYQELERCLRDELGDTPSANTRALAEELRRSARTFVTAHSAPRSPAPDSRPPEQDELDSIVRGRRPSCGLEGDLPPQFTRFFGREGEIARLVQALCVQETRLVTLTGPGGSGKTRLAIAAAGRFLLTFEGAIVYVPLVDLVDPGRIAEALANALRLPPTPRSDRLDEVVEALGRRRSLLVLDNFEQLLPDGSLLVRSLLVRVPALTCLVTSRQRLNLAGEQEFVVLPLPTPRRSDSLERLMELPSIQLFLDRARAVCSDFQISAGDAGVMAELCDRLEGLPLALELAAARMAVLTPRQLLAQLGHRFEILVGRQRDVPRRHQSLRAAIESSYRLLDPGLQRFFACLSVFRGGWTLDAARSVCEAGEERFGASGSEGVPARSAGHRRGPGPGGALDDLEHLRDCSLLTAVEERDGEARYRLLETLREFGWEQLVASGEFAAVRDRHRDWYLGLAEQAEAAAYGAEWKGWLARLEAERENLRAALAWCRESDEAAGAGTELRLATALWWFWVNRGPFGEGIQWLEGALARGSPLLGSLRARAFYRLASLASTGGDAERNRECLLAARREYEGVLKQDREDEDALEIAESLRDLTWVCFGLGDREAAWRLGLEARQRLEALDHREGIVEMLQAQAWICLSRGDRPRARALLKECLTLCRKLSLSLHLIHVLGRLGHLLRDEGKYAEARAHYQESLKIRWEMGLLFPVAQSLEDLAVLAGRQGQAERVTRLLGMQAAVCETVGSPAPTVNAKEYERMVSESRAALGEAAFAHAWSEGQAMPLQEAIREALDAQEDPTRVRWAPGTRS